MATVKTVTIKYNVETGEVTQGQQEFNKLNNSIKKTEKSAKKAEGSFKNIGQNITQIAGTLGIAFGVQKIAAFVVESAKLAGQLQGVQTAFGKLNKKDLLMYSGQYFDAYVRALEWYDIKSTDPGNVRTYKKLTYQRMLKTSKRYENIGFPYENVKNLEENTFVRFLPNFGKI